MDEPVIDPLYELTGMELWRYVTFEMDTPWDRSGKMGERAEEIRAKRRIDQEAADAEWRRRVKETVALQARKKAVEAFQIPMQWRKVSTSE